jgi:hypothetical protein
MAGRKADMTTEASGEHPLAEMDALIARLIDRAKASEAALDSGDTARLKAAAAELALLARGYEAKVKAISAAGAMAAAERQALARLARHAHVALAPHERRLRAAVAAQRQWLGCVAEAAQAAAGASAPYRPDGGRTGKSGRRQAIAPVAICRTL